MFNRFYVAGIAFTASLALWLSSASADPAWQEVVAAAKKEGSVTVYSGIVGTAEFRTVAKNFQAKYGIKVNALEGVATEIAERARTEFVMKKPGGDVYFSGLVAQYTLKLAGALSSPGNLPNLKNLAIKPGFEDDVPVFLYSWGMLVNSRLVPPDQEPKSWRDILDPKWKGKIIAAEPTAPGAGNVFCSVMKDAFGIDFVRSFAAQGAAYSQDSRVVERRVAQGEYPLYVTFVVSNIFGLANLPLKAIVPTEGLFYLPMSANVLKNAANPNAARLFVNYMLDPEAQLVYGRAGIQMAVQGLQRDVPPDKSWIVNAKLLGTMHVEGFDERLREWAAIFKK